MSAEPVEIRRDDEGGVDEIVAHGVNVQIERMTDDMWFIGITSAEREWRFSVQKSGREVKIFGGTDA